MKKRFFAMVLALALVCALIPALSSQSSAASGVITRAQWVSSLVDAFDMTVDDETAPDNYYSDLTGEEDYYRDILVATEFGLIDVEAGMPFRPEEPATREFVAHILNACLQYQLDDESTYTFAESSSVSYPDDIQVAINRGWFSLSNGSFLPSKPITAAESEAMLADVSSTLATQQIDANYNSTYAFAAGVKEVPNGTEVTIDGDTVIITECPISISSGDQFVIWYNGLPCAYTAGTVTTSEEETTITAAAIEDGSAFSNVDAQGEAGVSVSQFVPADGVDVIYIDENTGEEYDDPQEAEASVRRSVRLGGSKKLATIALKVTVPASGDLTCSFNVKLKDPTLEYKISSAKGHSYVRLNGKYEVSLSADLELIEQIGQKEVTLGFWGVPGVGGLDVSAVFSLKGSIKGQFTGTFSVGVEYDCGSLSVPRDFHSDGFSFEVEASCKAGLKVSFGINKIPGDLISGYVYFEIGGKASLKMTKYDEGTPQKCVHFKAYLYSEYGAKISAKYGTKVELSVTKEIWKDSNSPIRIVHHYEDGVEVAKCTRGDTDDNGYYTSSGSHYCGSCWGGANGAWGLDSNGNPVQVYSYTVDNEGNASITGYSGNATALSIPATLDGHTVVAINNEAFRNKTAIRSVVFSDTITSIGRRAFNNCANLGSVTLPKNLTYLGYLAFGNCTALDSITIPKTLETADNYYENGGPFTGSGITTAIIEPGMTTVPDNLFRSVAQLTNVIIPDTVTRIDRYAFNNCANLGSVTLPKNLTYLGYRAFGNCTALDSITIPKSLVTADNYYEDGGPFSGSGITVVNIEQGMKAIPSYLFASAHNLNYIIIPDTVTSFGTEAFYSTAFKEFSISNKITSIGDYCFADCSLLEKAVWGCHITQIPTGTFKDCSALKTVDLGEEVSSIGSHCFENCDSLEEITLPDSLSKISDCAFRYCDLLETIELPDNVDALGQYAFADCNVLASIKFGENTETIGYSCFQNCNSLISVSINDKLRTIRQNAFNNCDALTDITIPDSVTDLGSNLFEDCNLLARVNLGTGVTTIPEKCFFECPSLQKVDLPYRVKTIGSKAFANCTGLTEVTILRNATDINTNAFSYPAILTIYGVSGSNAEAYANTIGATFVPINVPATAVSLNESTLRLAKGASYQLIASITPTNFTDATAWKSNNSSVATVNDDGLIKAVGIGEANISFVVGNIKASCNVVVVQPVTSISLNKTSLSLNAGDSFQLTATVSPSTAENQEVSWSSSDDSIAAVDENGVVTALKKGSAKITAMSKDGNGASRSCTVTVLNNLIVAATVDELQSPHPYETNCSDFWVYSIPNANSLSVTFSAETSVEENSDYIYIYSADGTLIGKYTGAELAGQTIQVPGDTVKIQLVSDSSYCEYGFAVTGVSAVQEHTHSYEAVITEPTCTEQGYTTYTCSVCGDSYVDSYAPALGHAWGEGVVTVEPTEDSEGVRTFTCTRCGATKTEAIPKTDHVHTYIDVVTEPTCTAQGYTTHTCTKCGYSYRDMYTNALGHDWNAPTYAWSEDYGTVTAARTCKRDESHVETETVATTSEVTKEATVDTEGEITYTATFVNPAFETQTKSVATPKLEKPDDPTPITNPFKDVKDGTYYYNAVMWAVQNGITSGTSTTTFSPNDGCTRAQVVTFLWRAAGSPEPKTTSNPFADVPSGKWYSKAVLWAAEEGITAGTSATTFSPDATCTRGQIVTFLWRYEGQPSASTTVNPFKDVKAGAYYEKAVLWAAETGVTAGTSDTTFSPDATCTRAQVVTFLYRDMAK